MENNVHPILRIMFKNVLRTFEDEILQEHSASTKKLDVLVKEIVLQQTVVQIVTVSSLFATLFCEMNVICSTSDVSCCQIISDNGVWFLSCRLKPMDVHFMKVLHTKVNIVPIIAKTDCLTRTEISTLKRTVG